jgi:hypothetical protein
MHVAFVDELNGSRICRVKLIYDYFLSNNLVSTCRKTHLVPYVDMSYSLTYIS